MDDLSQFLSTIGMVQGLEPAQIRELAGACIERRYAAGEQILTQGSQSSTLYFLRTGVLAVRVTRGRDRITVAHLEPPAVVGEVSFATGRTCSADVDVAIDARVVTLSLAALEHLPVQRDHLVRGLTLVIADRFHAAMTRGIAAAPRPIVLLRPSPGWPAPRPFAVALAAALARELAVDSLVVQFGDVEAPEQPARVGAGVWQTCAPGGPAASSRAALAEPMSAWRARFGALVINGGAAVPSAEDLGALASHHVWLLGPGEPPPATLGPADLLVQDARAPTLATLSARLRLVHFGEADRPLDAGRDLPPSVREAANAIARGIVGRQIGLALGGGGAWGWAHIGVLEVLERAGIAVDAIAGCSMGSVIGGMRASGATIADLHDLAGYWKRYYRRWSEWRFWRLHVASERRMRQAFQHMFGDRRLNMFLTPFWANAIDIETGGEVIIRDGLLVDAVCASMAFPGWTPPVRRGARWLVDAAMIDPVPAALVNEMGCDRVIAVNTFGPMTPRTLASRLPWQAYDVLERYLRIAAHEVGRIHGEVAGAVTIAPLVGDSTMISFQRCDELIEAGRRAAEERLPAIREMCLPVVAPVS